MKSSFTKGKIYLYSENYLCNLSILYVEGYIRIHFSDWVAQSLCYYYNINTDILDLNYNEIN
jgi:hypothetical protein